MGQEPDDHGRDNWEYEMNYGFQEEDYDYANYKQHEKDCDLTKAEGQQKTGQNSFHGLKYGQVVLRT
jgi:hypothetical protein